MDSTAYFRKIYRNFPWNQRHISVKPTETFHGIKGIFPQSFRHCSMKSTKLPWNQRQKYTAFHKLPQFFVVDLFAINCMETLKTPSEYSVDFNHGFQRFSMANLEKGRWVSRASHT